MPNKLELLDEVITSLFKVGDKSSKEYDEIFDEFNISELKDIKDFPPDKLQKILNRVKSVLKTGSKNMFTSKNFDKEVEDVLLRQAIKLAEETNEEEKEVPNDVPEEEKKTSPAEEEKKEDQEEGEAEEAKKIEDIVKDQQISLIEKMNAVKSFKPGRSEAINFRNAVNELIKVAESAVSSINDYYQKELGSGEEEEKPEGKTSSRKRASDESYYKSEIQKILPLNEYGAKVQLESSKGKTKWLNLNKISLNVINIMLKGLI